MASDIIGVELDLLVVKPECCLSYVAQCTISPSEAQEHVQWKTYSTEVHNGAPQDIIAACGHQTF